MKKDPAICPKCGTKVAERPLLKPRRNAAPKPAPQIEPANENIDDTEFPEGIEDVELDENDVELDDAGEDDLLVDEDIDDDVSGVAEHIEAGGDKDQ